MKFLASIAEPLPHPKSSWLLVSHLEHRHRSGLQDGAASIFPLEWLRTCPVVQSPAPVPFACPQGLLLLCLQSHL